MQLHFLRRKGQCAWALPGPWGLYLPSESLLLSPGVNLVPLLARHLTPSERPSASWQDQCLHDFWQDFQAENCSMHRNRGLPQQYVHFAQGLAEQQAERQPGSEVTPETAWLTACRLGSCQPAPAPWGPWGPGGGLGARDVARKGPGEPGFLGHKVQLSCLETQGAAYLSQELAHI